MSKKLIYFRIIIIVICLLFVCGFVFVISNLQHLIESKNITVEEIHTNDNQIINFDLKKTPKQQKKMIIEHKNEYLKQLYDYAFDDEKFSNCLGYDYLSAYEIVEDFKDTENLIYVFKKFVYPSLFNKLFCGYEKEISNVIILDDLPVTENYKQKHPNPLYEEFNFIKKESYKYPKIYYSEIMDFDYWYEFGYNYHIGVDEENKTICVGEDKYCNRVHKDRETGIETSGIVRDKEGNEVPIDVHTRNFYFTYTTDEKGYVDDIVYDRTEIINDDKYLDSMIKYE